ncbi:MAG: hypothetical protein R3B70_29120 [Polyangiaceae bacterium]
MTRKLSRAAAISAFLTGLFAPVLAQACPVCAQGETGGVGRKIALGAFLLLPFVVVTTVIFVLRSAIRREQKMFVQRSEV